MKNLIQHLLNCRDSAAPIAQQYGVPSSRSLIICSRTTGNVFTYLLIEPNPIIQQVSPSLVEAFQSSSAQIELDDIEVKGISKKYSRQQLVGRGISYLIDGTFVSNSQVTGGFGADRVTGMDLIEKTLSWDIVLRRRKNDQ